MAEVVLSIGGRQYGIHCRDGEEGHLHTLATRIDSKMDDARRNAPGMTEVRQLLFAALLLADEVNDLSLANPAQRTATPDSAAPGEEMMTARINVLAARIETLAQRLAPEGTTP
jgi:cell division protein ZapA